MGILVKNGLVYDMDRNSLARRDVRMEDGRISEDQDEKGTDEILDASGCFVLPALTDTHAHVNRNNHGFGTDADLLCIPNGVQTVIDAGSLGIVGMERFIEDEIAAYQTRVKVLVHGSSHGQRPGVWESLADGSIEEAQICDLFRKYPDTVCGIKLRYEKDIVGDLGLLPLKRCIRMSDRLQMEGYSCPVVVHLGDLGETAEVEGLLDLLRPNDVLAHAYQGRGQTILDRGDRVRASVWEARKRGVLFDLAHGRTCFSFPVLKCAFEQGFYPDFLGTDIHCGNRYRFPAFSMMCTMTMVRQMGMREVDIFKAVTGTPARVFGLSDRKNRFRPGDPADISVLRLVSKELELVDVAGNGLRVEAVFQTEAVIHGGELWYRGM